MSSQPGVQSLVVENLPSPQPGSWLAAGLSGLPHMLMGLLIGFGKINGAGEDPFSQTASSVIAILLGLLVIVVLIYAWRGGWPVWSASWYLYGTWVTVVVLGLVIANLPLRDSWRYSNLLFLGWIILCVIGYIALVLKSRLHGLLAVAFLFPFLGILMLEFIPDAVEGWLALSLGILAAVVCGVIVKIGELRTAVLLVLVYNLFAGLALAYISEYQMRDLPPGVPAHVPEISTFIVTLGVYSLVVLGILAIPIILKGLWDLVRRKLSA